MICNGLRSLCGTVVMIVESSSTLAGFPYDLQQSAIGLRHVADIWKHSPPASAAVSMIVKVESSSTFPPVTTLPIESFLKWKRVSELICVLPATHYCSP